MAKIFPWRWIDFLGEIVAKKIELLIGDLPVRSHPCNRRTPFLRMEFQSEFKIRSAIAFRIIWGCSSVLQSTMASSAYLSNGT